MKKTRFKKLSAFVLAAVMGLAMSITVSAAPTIDPAQTGSLTIHKYDGDAAPEGYMSQTEMEEWIQANSSSLTPLEGVVFSYLNVGSVKQYTEDNVTKIGYSVNTALTSFLGLSAGDADYTEGSTDYYTTKTLGEKLKSKSQGDLETFMSNNGATAMPATDAQGQSTVGSLPQGLYLVVETTYPAGTVMTTEPFFVSIPMTDVDEGGTYNWIYDVHAYPKNKVEVPDIDKSVVEDGDESLDIDGEIGQSKVFRVRADVPANVGKTNTYKITDTLSAGLTYDTSVTPKVYGVQADGTRELLTDGGEYTFTQSGQTLTFDFTTAQLADPDTEQAKYIRVEIEYNAIVNENAVVGKPGNKNDVKLEYSTSTNVTPGNEETETETPTTLPTIYTYAIDLLKYGDSDTGNPLANVTFELYRAGEPDNGISNATKLNVTKGGDGTYYLSGTSGSPTLTTDENGKIKVKGLETGTYYLVETATNEGYNLLAEPIKITITSTEGQYHTDDAGTFAPIEAGKTYFSAPENGDPFVLPENAQPGDYINFGTSEVYDQEGNPVQMYAPDEFTWNCNYSMNAENGEISLSVNNSSGFELPRTGGSGTTWFLIIGGVLVVAAGIVIVAASRKKNKSDAE